MNILLDTHTLLWFYNGDNQLSKNVEIQIKDVTNSCFISIVSLWEITIKYSIGKLELDDSLNDLFLFVNRNLITVLDIEFDHLLRLSSLPHHHKGPFDRIIVAQSIRENYKIATKDELFKDYPIEIFW
jgi:PIN domain nuclease of toxin-antitoxin system